MIQTYIVIIISKR